MSPSDKPTITLRSELDIKAAAPLAAELAAMRGGPLQIDGSAVERLGAQCLQVLLSASATWDADGLELELTGPSPAMLDAIESAGTGLASLSTKGR